MKMTDRAYALNCTEVAMLPLTPSLITPLQQQQQYSSRIRCQHDVCLLFQPWGVSLCSLVAKMLRVMGDFTSVKQ
jgi:hypothetical protein